MQKKERKDLILNFIRSERVGRQDVLVEKLAQHGFLVTQASVSRDLEELGVVKTDGVYVIETVLSAAMEFGLRSLETAGDNLIVGKCDPGLASAITVRIDGGQIGEIVGTIAGDDTIFIAVKDAAQQAVVITKIWALSSV